MAKIPAFAVCFILMATAAWAQDRGPTSAITPGVPAGTTGTSYGVPGAVPTTSVPGGTIPQAASTQDANTTPSGLPVYNNSGDSRRNRH